MMFEIMVSEKSYDALPNFTAADCKGFREREGRKEEGEEGRKEGELVTPLKYNSVCRSAADGGWSEPVH